MILRKFGQIRNRFRRVRCGSASGRILGRHFRRCERSSPGMIVSMLRRKDERAGGQVSGFPMSTAAFCPVCGGEGPRMARIEILQSGRAKTLVEDEENEGHKSRDKKKDDQVHVQTGPGHFPIYGGLGGLEDCEPRRRGKTRELSQESGAEKKRGSIRNRGKCP